MRPILRNLVAGIVCASVDFAGTLGALELTTRLLKSDVFGLTDDETGIVEPMPPTDEFQFVFALFLLVTCAAIGLISSKLTKRNALLVAFLATLPITLAVFVLPMLPGIGLVWANLLWIRVGATACAAIFGYIGFRYLNQQRPKQ